MRIELPMPTRNLSPNRSRKVHFGTVTKVKNAYGEQCLPIANVAVRSSGWVPRKGDIPMKITFHFTSRTRHDADNSLGSMKRGLDVVAAAMGVDDAQFWPMVLERTFGAKYPHVVIEVD